MRYINFGIHFLSSLIILFYILDKHNILLLYLIIMTDKVGKKLIVVSPEVHEKLRKLKFKHECDSFQELFIFLMDMEANNP
jgi:hypothetical protein